MIWLIIAHFIGDWGLQNRWMAENKSKYIEILIAHSIIITGCICIALQYSGLFSIWKFYFLFLSHAIIDFISSNWYKKTKKRIITSIDHLFHFITLLIVYYY